MAAPQTPDLNMMAMARAAGRLLLGLLLFASVTLLLRSASPEPSARPVIAAASMLQFASSGASAAVEARAGKSDRFSAAAAVLPAPVPEADPPGQSRTAPPTLDSALPTQVGRFTRDQVTRPPMDATVSDSIVIRYRTPDDAVAVYGAAIANTLDDADTVRNDIVKTMTGEQGMAVTSYEYGRTSRGDPIIVVNSSSGQSVGTAWSIGRLVSLVRAHNQATATAFLNDLALWPKGSRVKWQTNLFQAYQQASNEGRPLIAYFFFKTCNNCRLLGRNVLGAEEMNGMSRTAVFTQVDVENDDDKKNVSRMIESLGLESYPVVAVLDAAPTQIKERGRVSGYFEPAEFYGQFRKLLPALPFNLVSR